MSGNKSIECRDALLVGELDAPPPQGSGVDGVKCVGVSVSGVVEDATVDSGSLAAPEVKGDVGVLDTALGKMRLAVSEVALAHRQGLSANGRVFSGESQ
ncbi:hypothetical protein MKZ38_002681 [Zalerion maritima]|uniref:Uncharacterized protein n=1 Tax=Zalerion maritima TaxID=339359 RepID=A0AAD5RVG1_9PEZI|nr:hypothetical protein MKZ38_002681 [Zalerion maritima]